jgi:hypothetical protein
MDSKAQPPFCTYTSLFTMPPCMAMAEWLASFDMKLHLSALNDCNEDLELCCWHLRNQRSWT